LIKSARPVRRRVGGSAAVAGDVDGLGRSSALSKTSDPDGPPLRLRYRSHDQFRLRRTCPSGPCGTL